MFNRFDRVAEAGVRGEAALGLGLPLTQQFLEAHGGAVELHSETTHVNQGRRGITSIVKKGNAKSGALSRLE